jgi:thioredoxin-dependent peroxiredoxin
MTTHAPLIAGDAAPDFDLESDDGKHRSLADFAGEWLVLYFYPKDDTPGCTREAQGFSEAAARLTKLGARVAGVSKDSIKSHCSFRDKYRLKFPLLSDPDLATHVAYGAWGTKTLYGRKFEGTIRSTFLIAPDGTVARAWRGVKVDGHVDVVIGQLAGGKGGAKTPPGKPTRAAKKTSKPTPAKKVATKRGKTR